MGTKLVTATILFFVASDTRQPAIAGVRDPWNMSALKAIKARVEAIAGDIDAPTWLLPTYEQSDQTGLPHIEVTSDGAMHWVVCERGGELERRTTFDRNELLYWIFNSVTAEMASRWEVEHRIETEDFRKQMFVKQFELLDSVDPAWTARRKRELGSSLNDAGL